ncbi:hypothetical protein J6590_047588 [Homalodisca vitripennis]|nr:hypothetical protein J6590_047588 [Homalodisca vitripennis]
MADSIVIGVQAGVGEQLPATNNLLFTYCGQLTAATGLFGQANCMGTLSTVRKGMRWFHKEAEEILLGTADTITKFTKESVCLMPG